MVLFLSSRPNLALPPLFPNIDKVAHFCEYAAMGALLHRALRLSGARRKASILTVIGLVAALALGDEKLQSYIPGRDADLHDCLADVLGGTTGALVVRWLESRLPPGWLAAREIPSEPARPEEAIKGRA